MTCHGRWTHQLADDTRHRLASGPVCYKRSGHYWLSQSGAQRIETSADSGPGSMLPERETFQGSSKPSVPDLFNAEPDRLQIPPPTRKQADVADGMAPGRLRTRSLFPLLSAHPSCLDSRPSPAVDLWIAGCGQPGRLRGPLLTSMLQNSEDGPSSTLCPCVSLRRWPVPVAVTCTSREAVACLRSFSVFNSLRSHHLDCTNSYILPLSVSPPLRFLVSSLLSCRSSFPACQG